jgi:hypothetical protein
MVINIFMFILLAQNEPKGQPFTWSARGGLPCAVHKERATSESRMRSAESLIHSLFHCSAA